MSSSLLTFILFLAMALYLVQGKLFGGSLYPQVMISLACLLAAQSVWAIIYRLLLLSGKLSLPRFYFKKKKSELFNGAIEEASHLLCDTDFSQVRRGNEKENTGICFIKGIKKRTILEIAVFCAVLFILISGILNYGFGISGQVNVSPGGEMIDMGIVRLDRGFFAERFATSFKLRAGSITDTVNGEPSTAVLEIMDGKSGELTTHRVGTGDSITINRLRMQYRGDAYMAFIAMYKKSHDYRPATIRFESWTGNPEKPYSAPIYIRTPGVKGEAEFDTVSRKLKVRVYRDETPEFDGELLSGTKEIQGDVMVQFTSLMHYGTFDISRYGYRNQVLGGMVALVLFLVLRIVFRAGMVCLWTEGERVYFYTRDSAIKRLLLE